MASLLDVVEDQQHVGATSPNQSGAPLKFVEPVKRWAKAEVDAIEAWLSDMAPQVDVYNGTIDEFIDSLIEQRRAVLATAESLRAELDDGI